MKKQVINYIDNYLYKFLDVSVDIMPLRFTKMIAMFYGDARIRRKYWIKLGVNIGTNSYMNFGFNVITSTQQNFSKLLIGDNVSIGPNLTIILDSKPNNSKHLIDLPYVREKLCVEGTIKIGNEAWIGANVTILPNITIGEGAIIGAGSII